MKLSVRGRQEDGPGVLTAPGAEARAAELVNSRLQTLYDLTDRLLRTRDLSEICEAALDALDHALGCSRASVLLFDPAGAMRFVAWRGISDAYRAAVDGHTPWVAGEPGAGPIAVADILEADESDALKASVTGEGIRALAFVPLTEVGGGVIGKFMVYRAEPYTFSAEEMNLALNIARQLSFAIERTRSEERALRHSEQFEAVFDNIPVMIKLFEPQSSTLRLNREFTQVLGWTSEDARKTDLMAELFPDEELRERVRSYMDECQPGWFDVPMIARDGRQLETSWANIRLSDSSRVGIGIDITDRKLALERQLLLLREMDHRVRNLFSLASSMVRLSAREPGDRAELAADLQERLAALASAHALTTRQPGEEGGTVSLHGLVGAILTPYQRGEAVQIRILGDDIRLSGEAATSFAILIYEFATNAAKYGALSVEDGCVTVTTRRRDGRLELDWEEDGGPEVAPPPSEGFGTRLTKATVGQLGGSLERHWRPAGLSVQLLAALDRCEALDFAPKGAS